MAPNQNFFPPRGLSRKHASKHERSSPPEVFELGRGQLGVEHCVLDILVSEISLEGASVVSLGGQRKPAGMSQHVRMRLESELRLLTRARSTMCAKPAVVKGDLRHDSLRGLRVLTLRD